MKRSMHMHCGCLDINQGMEHFSGSDVQLNLWYGCYEAQMGCCCHIMLSPGMRLLQERVAAA